MAGLPRKAKITVILLPEDFVRFEAYCKERGFKKSTLIARLVRNHMDSEGFRLQRDLQTEAPTPKKARA